MSYILINNTNYIDYIIPTATIIYEDTETISDEWAEVIAFPGKLWVNTLKLVVLPLIVLMMVILPSRVHNIKFIAKRAVPLYVFTSIMAAFEGTAWVWIIQPGNVEKEADVGTRTFRSQYEVSELDAVLNIFFNAVPSNIIRSMSDLNILGIIVFFLVFGIFLQHDTIKQVERDAVLNICKAMLRCCMSVVGYVIWFAPIGMCSLVCIKFATTENLNGLLEALGFYVLTVLIGHTVHVFGFYPLLLFTTTRGNGWRWFTKIYEAPLLAFATSSSAATLPRSLQVARKAGVRESVYQFTLPLGATINMDGTASGFPIMIGLIAQLNDIPLTFADIISVSLLSIVISLGTAPIPNAGMVYITMLFEAAGMGDIAGEGLATLFVLDWFVDRIETSVNVISDHFVSKIIDDISQITDKKKGKVCGCCLTPNNDANKLE
eukprot:115350_1